MATTIIIHESATEEQAQRAIRELEGLFAKFGVTDWKREGKKIVFDKTISSQEKSAFLMIPRVVSVTIE